MRSLTVLVVASLALALPTSTVAAKPGKPVKPRPDLVAKAVTGSLTGTTLFFSATIKNKGPKKSKTSLTTFRLSKDAVASADDLVVASAATKKRKPKKKVSVSASAALPPTLPPGSYRVIACADSGSKVKERKETNNCKAGSTVVVAAPPTVTITWRSAGFGDSTLPQVTPTVTGGTCTGAGQTGSCTVSGLSSVTLTASVPPPSTFVGWSADTGATCAGAVVGTAITFTNANAAQGCVATFAVAS